MLGRFLALSTVLLALAAAPASAQAQTAGDGAAAATSPSGPSLTVELNKLENTGNLCRAYFIVRNGSDQPLDDFALDTFLFDTNEVILQRLALPFGAVREQRMRIVSFDFELDCAAIGKLFVNEVLTCEGGGGLDCAGALATQSRTNVPMEY